MKDGEKAGVRTSVGGRGRQHAAVNTEETDVFWVFLFSRNSNETFFLDDHFEISKSSETTRTHLERSATRIKKTVAGMFFVKYSWLSVAPTALRCA